MERPWGDRFAEAENREEEPAPVLSGKFWAVIGHLSFVRGDRPSDFGAGAAQGILGSLRFPVHGDARCR